MLKFILLALLGYLVTFFSDHKIRLIFDCGQPDPINVALEGEKMTQKHAFKMVMTWRSSLNFGNIIYIYILTYTYIYIYGLTTMIFIRPKPRVSLRLRQRLQLHRIDGFWVNAPITRSEFWEFLLFLGFFDYVKSCGYCFSGFVSVLPIPQHGICFFVGALRKSKNFSSCFGVNRRVAGF